jgi:hypothetical protein
MQVEHKPQKPVEKTEKEILREKYAGEPITATIRNELLDQMLKDNGYLVE